LDNGNFKFISFIFSAQKRAAWRQARLKSLENDAIQAQIMIQTMNKAAVLMEEQEPNEKDATDGAIEETEYEPESEDFSLQEIEDVSIRCSHVARL
jgi:hypothetical protein